MKPKCFLCKEKTARVIRALTVLDRNGKAFEYSKAYKGAAFCSKRCATNYGLIVISDMIEGYEDEGGWFWNETENEWQPCD